MLTPHQTLCRNIAILALKIVSSTQKISGAVSPDFDIETGENAKKLIKIFIATPHSYDVWLPDIKLAYDNLIAQVEHAIGNIRSQTVLQDRLTNTADATVRQIITEMRQINERTIITQLANFVPEVEPTPAVEADGNSDPTATATKSVPGYSPIMIPPINYGALAGVDRIISQATGGVVTSARTIFDKLDEAQRAIASGIHSPAIHIATTVPANGADPSGRMKLTPALAAFVDAIPADETDGFNFDIPIYHWDSPHPRVPRQEPGYQFDTKVLRKALFAIAHGLNVVFVGPPGCGKTVLTGELAARLGRPYYRIPINGEMRKREMIGADKLVATETGSKSVWNDGLLCKAVSEPSIIGLDEIDRADPDLQYVAHQAYERNGITLLEDGGRFIAPHPHHSILATANTRGRDDGENLYEMRNQMSEATRDRFAFWIDCTYMTPEQELKKLSIDTPGLHKDSANKIISFANLMRGAFLSGKLSTTCSYRSTYACAAFATTASSASADLRMKSEIDAIHAILVSRAPLRNEVAALQEFGRQIYGPNWITT